MPVDMTLVTVDEAIWKAEFSPSRHLERLEEATVRIPFDWVAGDPYKIELFTANGWRSKKRSPSRSRPQGLLRGCSLFSPLWDSTLVFFRWRSASYGCRFYGDLGQRWINFFLSFTVGLLVFLGLDALHEGFEVAGQLPGVFSGIGLLGIGFTARISAHHWPRSISSRSDLRAAGEYPLILAYMIAFGIGIHNLGEGLAIGSAYAAGEIALGALLLVGLYRIHNTTEGLAIVSPLARSTSQRILHLVLLGCSSGERRRFSVAGWAASPTPTSGRSSFSGSVPVQSSKSFGPSANK